MENPPFQPDIAHTETVHAETGKGTTETGSVNKALRHLSAAIAFSAAALIGGCASSDPGKIKQLEDQVAELNGSLKNCEEDRMPDLSKDGAVLSFGTFGMKWLSLEKETRLTASKDLEEVEQNFLIWPQVTNADEITVEGNANNFSLAKVGSHFEVVYKSTDKVPKESLVIEIRKKRYVIFIEHK